MLIGLVVVAVVLVIVYMIANIIVEKRLWLARRILIGRDSPERVEELKELANRLFDKGTLNVMDDFKAEKEHELTIKLFKGEEGVITKVMVSTENTIVTYSTEAPEASVCNNGFSEDGATILVFVELIGIILFIGLLLFTLYFCMLT